MRHILHAVNQEEKFEDGLLSQVVQRSIASGKIAGRAQARRATVAFAKPIGKCEVDRVVPVHAGCRTVPMALGRPVEGLQCQVNRV